MAVSTRTENLLNVNSFSLMSVFISLAFIKIGGILHGYSSDITRTFLPPGMDIEKCVSSGNNVSLGEMWDVVHSAQSAGIEAILTNHTCAEVDLAARKVIEDAGLGQYFGHRLGHGLGIVPRMTF